MQGESTSICRDILLGEVAKLKVAGYRFVTISCVETSAEVVELLYHFDKDFNLRHLRLGVPHGAQVPSISPLYFAAFLVENEIQDLFGLCFDGLVIDYGRTLYLDGDLQATPFCKYSLKAADAGGD